MKEKLFGGTHSISFELEELLDDEMDQIVISDTLFESFDVSSKLKKNYNKRKSWKLFKHVVYMYNNTFGDSRFGALTYLTKIVESLDYLKPETLMELSLSKLNCILDNQNVEIENEYNKLKSNRRTISKEDFKSYLMFLENNHNVSNAKEMFKYVSQLYNDNAIIQDNISIIDYLKEMATIKSKKLFSMRLYEITQRLSIIDIDYENFNEEKKLLNDVE